MKNLNEIIKELESERRWIDAAIKTLRSAVGKKHGRAPNPRMRRKLSAAGRARIAAAQRARWAKVRKAQKG
jgi:hypothetical protein